jgi:CRISPR-associated protein Cas2
MKKFDFIIGYDISSPKRLRKIAKVLERVAVRIQYSLFLYSDVSKVELERLIDEILKIIDKKEDDIRIYRIDKKRSLSMMSGFDLCYPKIFIGEDDGQ